MAILPPFLWMGCSLMILSPPVFFSSGCLPCVTIYTLPLGQGSGFQSQGARRRQAAGGCGFVVEKDKSL